MIEDEKSLIAVDEFRKLFFMYFKGESKANLIYEKLLPHIIVWNVGDKVFNSPTEMDSSDQLIEGEKMVSIRKLSEFIDSFNFFPVKVNKIHFKNVSKDMTYVMTSNTKSDLAAKDETKKWQEKNFEEQRLIKLLSLISYKLHERFRNLREAFRYIDTDHSQSISINEFA